MNLLLAAVLLLQDKVAEETFKKIELATMNARTLSMKFEFQDPDRQVQGSGTVLAKANKLNLVYQAQAFVDGKIQGGKTHLMCDGQNMVKVTSSGARQVNVINVVATAILRTGFSRLMAAFDNLGSDPGAEEKEVPLHPGASDLKAVDPAHTFEVKGIATGDDDGEIKTLTYFMKEKGHTKAYAVRVWYDPKTFALRKRTVTGSMGFGGKGPETTVTETYEEFTLNADIPDEKFKLPQEKK